MILLAPGGGYAPDPDADWHLLVGDESALPAIARTVERMPDTVSVHAFVEVAGPLEEQSLTSAATLSVTRPRSDVHVVLTTWS